MYKNYFFLNRIVIEANKIIQDFMITSIFSQDKDKLIFILNKNGEEKLIEISVNPGFPYFTVKEKFNRAKKNTLDFFENYLPLKLILLEIAENDRIIKIKTDKCNFYFSIRGKFTNVCLVDSKNKITNFKKMPDGYSDESFINEINSTKFISYFNIPEFKIENFHEYKIDIKKKYPIISKEIIFELENRTSYQNEHEIIKELKKIIKEIEVGNPVVSMDNQTHDINLIIESFNIFKFDETKLFGNLISALNYFISKKYYFEIVESKRKIIRNYLENSLEKLSNKINNVKTSIERGCRTDEYQKLGNLLLVNINLIRTGMENIEVKDIYDGNTLINIKLDRNISPQMNINKYFDKAKSDKIKFDKSKELYSNLTKQYKKLKAIEEKFLSEISNENYELIMNELKLNQQEKNPKKDDIQSKFKHYLIEGKYHVYVGKDSKNNDLLTIQFAKQNDYWFHARSVAGSHVVLRVENTKEVIPKNILKKAASLAAYHSKAKTSGLAPVSFTQKKYVVKKKGMEPGKVALLKEDVLIVKPEIPSDTVYLTVE